MSEPLRKHPCPDCRHCQWCGDDRCRPCRRPSPGAGKKLSPSEQIRCYEELNRTCRETEPRGGPAKS